MRANFIYSDLNPCGGGERFTLVTMQALFEMGVDIELTTLEEPKITKLENAYGKDLASIIKNIKKVNVLSVFDEQSITNNMKNGCDVIIILTVILIHIIMILSQKETLLHIAIFLLQSTLYNQKIRHILKNTSKLEECYQYHQALLQLIASKKIMPVKILMVLIKKGT